MNSIWNSLKNEATNLSPLDRIDNLIIENLSRRIQTLEKDPFQIVTACMLISVHQGGLCISLDQSNLANRIRDFLAFFPDTINVLDLAKKLAQRFLEHKTENLFSQVIGSTNQYFPMIEFNSKLYFQKFHSAEKVTGERIFELLKSPGIHPSDAQITEICTSILTRYPLTIGTHPNTKPIQFTNQQSQALAVSLRNKLTIINGGPGTGKTSIATNLLRAWTQAWVKGYFSSNSKAHHTKAHFPRIKLASPTGRASQRLAETISINFRSISYPSVEKTTEELNSFEIDSFISQIPCQTLHGLLGYNPGSGKYFYNAEQNLPADLILIDEVSMVDVFLLAQLLLAIEKNTCLIFLGDMDQLPSVDAGSVLSDLISKRDKKIVDTNSLLKNNIVTLEKSHRFQSQISNIAESINNMDSNEAFEKLKSNRFIEWPVPYHTHEHKFSDLIGCYWLTPKSANNDSAISSAEFRQELSPWLDSWINFHFLKHSYNPEKFLNSHLIDPKIASYSELLLKLLGFNSVTTPEFLNLVLELFKYQNQARILTFTRIGWYGTVSINQKIGLKLGPIWDSSFIPTTSHRFHGAPIIILVNQPDKKLYNGDIGILLRINGQLMGCFQRGKEIEIFPETFLPRYELAFAITVHKSQGSEYDQIFLILPEAKNRLLFKETLYTALTRARNFVGVYGSEAVFKEAVSKRIIRESGLLDYFQTKLFN